MRILCYKRPNIFLLILLILGFAHCNEASKEKNEAPEPKQPQQQEQKEETKQIEKSKDPVHKIKSDTEFKNILDNSGSKLIVIDLYADWCGPCKRLAPVLEKIAEENPDKADFYKVNIDELRNVAALFKVSNIPYVVFLTNRTVVKGIVGLHPRERYVSIINHFAK